MDYSEIKEKMSKIVESLNVRLSEVRAGRANPAILNKVRPIGFKRYRESNFSFRNWN